MVDRIVEQKETTAKTNFQLYAGGLYVPDSRLRQDGEFPNFKDDYTAGGPVAGFQLPFLRRPDSRTHEEHKWNYGLAGNSLFIPAILTIVPQVFMCCLKQDWDGVLTGLILDVVTNRKEKIVGHGKY